jgi:hypothetical protein
MHEQDPPLSYSLQLLTLLIIDEAYLDLFILSFLFSRIVQRIIACFASSTTHPFSLTSMAPTVTAPLSKTKQRLSFRSFAYFGAFVFFVGISIFNVSCCVCQYQWWLVVLPVYRLDFRSFVRLECLDEGSLPT